MPLPATDAGPPISALHAPAAALTMDAYAAIASQYVYRGVALRDRPTPSLELSTNTAGGWFTDFWAGLVERDGQRAYTRNVYMQNGYPNAHGNEWDIDLSVGYGAGFDNDWQWSIAAARIFDVADHGPSDDYNEWRASLFYRDVARAQFAYSEDYLQRGWSSWNAELGGSHGLTEGLRGEWGFGHSHGAGRADNDYDYGWLGLNASWLRTQWDARWVEAGHGARYVLDSNGGGSRFLLSLSWAFRLLP